MSQPPKPTSKSKTGWIATAGVLGALATAATVYAESGDWKTALPALTVALASALAAAIRDTMAKSATAQVEAVKEVGRQVKGVEAAVSDQTAQAAPPALALPPPEATVTDYVPLERRTVGETWQDREETAEEDGPL